MQNILNSGHGYIIIDQLAKSRLGRDFYDYVDTHTEEIFSEIHEPNSSIWVYKMNIPPA